MESDPTKEGGLPPLKITCTSANCDQGTHCFRPKKPRGKTAKQQLSLFSDPGGGCRACGAQLVDMPRVHQRDLSDSEHTVQALRLETIRHEYWCKPFDDKALEGARSAGMLGLREAAERRMRHKDVCSEAERIFRDGTQTPLEGSVIFFAQHALACCCRRCMEYWHGIPKDRPLLEKEIQYFVSLIMCYLRERLPDLEEEGRAMPRAPRANRKGKVYAAR